MKKNYQEPTVKVVEIQGITLLQGTNLRNVQSGDAGIDYNGGSNGPARAQKRSSIWDGMDD